MDPNDIAAGLWIVAGTTMCVSLGFMVRTQSRMMELQAELLKAVGEFGKAFAALAGQIMGGGSINVADKWRELPDAERAALRKALRSVLTDMDREMN